MSVDFIEKTRLYKKFLLLLQKRSKHNLLVELSQQLWYYKINRGSIMETFGELIKNVRIKTGISQRQAAKKIGITNSRLSKMERNLNSCPPEELRKLAILYQIPVIDLYIAAGYLTKEDLKEYQMVFRGVNELDKIETAHIQQCIDLLIKRRDHI